MAFQPKVRLHLGAEAEVWSGTWMGRPAVRKHRRSRAWRHPDLEKRLGYRRMLSEARILIRIKGAGLPVPAVWDVDLESGRIIMEKMNGRPLIEILRDENVSQDEIHKALHNSGCAVRMLHRMAVTHGDLSTNNILIDEDCNSFLIDFGLIIAMVFQFVGGLFAPGMFGGSGFELMIAGFGTVLFVAMSFVDFYTMPRRYNDEQYLAGALGMYLTYINLFVFVLRLIIALQGGGRRD